MSASQLETLLPLLDVAAFIRHGDGSFSAISQAPAWFERLTSDTTFPFLGHILEEANAFWQRGLQGSVDYGPCAEVDEKGQRISLPGDGRLGAVGAVPGVPDRSRRGPHARRPAEAPQ